MSSAQQEEAPRAAAPGRVQQGLRAIAWSLCLGFSCAGLFAIVASRAVPATLWIASHLAIGSIARSVLAILCLGIVQALICATALALFALASDLSLGVAIAASLFSGAIPLLVVLLAQGSRSLQPAPLLVARLVDVVLCIVAAVLSVRAVRRVQRHR